MISWRSRGWSATAAKVGITRFACCSTGARTTASRQVSSLGDANISLGDANISLGDAQSSLGDAESSLGDAKSSLGDSKSSLGDAKSSLGDAKSSLGDAKSSLGDTKSSLGDAKSALGDAKSSLCDAKSSLGDTKSSLGDAESSLGDTKSSLGDAKNSLGDALSSPGDAKSSLGGDITVFHCPECIKRDMQAGLRQQITARSQAQLPAESLPRTKLSDFLEQRLRIGLVREREERAKRLGKRLEEVETAEGLAVRLVSNVEKKVRNDPLRAGAAPWPSSTLCLSPPPVSPADS
jgi:hypothetical protein